MNRFLPHKTFISINPLEILLSSMRGTFQTKTSIGKHIQASEDKKAAIREGIALMQRRTEIELTNIITSLYLITNKAKQSPKETQKRAAKIAAKKAKRIIQVINYLLNEYQRTESEKMVAQDALAGDTEKKPTNRVSLSAIAQKNIELCESRVAAFSGLVGKATSEKEKKIAIANTFLVKKIKGKPKENIFTALARHVDSQLSFYGGDGIEKTDAKYGEDTTSLKEFTRIAREIVVHMQNIVISHADSRITEELEKLSIMSNALQRVITTIYAIKANGYNALSKILEVLDKKLVTDSNIQDYAADIFSKLENVRKELDYALHITAVYNPTTIPFSAEYSKLQFPTAKKTNIPYATRIEWMEAIHAELEKCSTLASDIMASKQFHALARLSVFVENLHTATSTVNQDVFHNEYAVKEYTTKYNTTIFSDLLLALNNNPTIKDAQRAFNAKSILPTIINALKTAFDKQDARGVHKIYAAIGATKQSSDIGREVLNFLGENPKIKEFVEASLRDRRHNKSADITAVKTAVKKLNKLDEGKIS